MMPGTYSSTDAYAGMTADRKRCEESLLNPSRPSCFNQIGNLVWIFFNVWFKILQENHQREAVGFLSER